MFRIKSLFLQSLLELRRLARAAPANESDALGEWAREISQIYKFEIPALSRSLRASGNILNVPGEFARARWSDARWGR